MLKTDLNYRERKRFAELLHSISDTAKETARILEADPYDDEKFIINFIVLGLGLNSLGELQKIVVDAARKAKEDAMPEFPPIIGG